MPRTLFKGLDYLPNGMGWYQDKRVKTGKLWRIKYGAPYQILIDKFGYKVLSEGSWQATILHNPKDGTFVVLGAALLFKKSSFTEDFLCDKVCARAYGLDKFVA